MLMRNALIAAFVLCGSMACKKSDRSEKLDTIEKADTTETTTTSETYEAAPSGDPSTAARATTAPRRSDRRPANRPESELVKPVILDLARVQWVEGPPSLPKGAKVAVLEGTPPFAEHKTFTLLAKFPKNYMIEPHIHLVTERVTVLDGSLSFGHAATVDRSTATKVTRGGLVIMPANHVHYAFTTDQEAVIALTGVGPWEIIYVDPKNDPRPTPARKPATPIKSEWDAPVAMKIIQSTDVRFAEPPAAMRMPAGVKMAVLEGDPAQAKTFVVRLQLAPNTMLPSHAHAHSQRFMVLSGGAQFGVGNDAPVDLKAPAVMLVPPEMPHVLDAGESGAVVQIVGVGPFDVEWLNPGSPQPRK
jgi:quercetin dioxygenase-like cupin family protein